VSSLTSDPVEAAKHLSQTGWLGTAWFHSLNSQGPQHMTNSAFLTGVALHLSLPIAAFEGRTCPCGCVLTAASGPRHIVSCNHYAKLQRSETFQHAFDSIIQDASTTARIEGAKENCGRQKQCAPYATVPETTGAGVPVIDPATGLPKFRNIIPDRVVRQMQDDKLGPGGRYIIDTVIPAPEANSHVTTAATTKLAAASRAYASKYETYIPVLKPGDVLLPVVCESWGGLHDCVKERLAKWAEELRKEGGSASGGGDTFVSAVSAIWQMRLSLALFHGRVNLVDAALDKLAGVPARSSTFAYSLSHGRNFRSVVQEWGRL
jgi:hypothetical protein